VKEKYQVIARKYRPQTFNDVVGQDAVVTTLKNAIGMHKAAHAYLFSGSRGIGKTTLARLFAKALNCQNLTKDLEPCCSCVSCKEISSSRSLDVIEIDGASNRGIDDIRHINETIGYAPSSGNYKIYIIDEVHMLTKEAFNALLKTLEEPPDTIKFFFATTESHKVLPTIISRCQRFDLSRIPFNLIIQKLKQIATDLNRNIEEEALYIIAKFSDGSLRDAESLLDQILCYEEGEITAETANKTLGFLPKDHFFEIDQAFAASDYPFVFNFVDKLFEMGKDLPHFVEELIEHYRQLLVTKIKGNEKSLSEDTSNDYIKAAAIYQEDQLFFIIDLLIRSQQHITKSPFKRVTVEMLLLQILQSKRHIPLSSLINRLMKLEKNSKIEEPLKPTTIENKIEKKEQPSPQKELQEVPFCVDKTDTKIEETDKKKISRNDTIMRFSSVELEGTIKTEN
jgi:DNA polymerase III subunit gamma/tau